MTDDNQELIRLGQERAGEDGVPCAETVHLLPGDDYEPTPEEVAEYEARQATREVVPRRVAQAVFLIETVSGKRRPDRGRAKKESARVRALAEQRFANWDDAAALVHRRRIRDYVDAMKAYWDISENWKGDASDKPVWPEEWGPM